MWYYVTFLLGLFSVGCVRAEKQIIFLPHGILQTALNCFVEHDLNPEILPKFVNPKLYKENNNSTRNVQQFAYCIFSKFNYIRKNGHLKIDKAIDLFPKDIDREPFRKLLEDCNEEEGNDGPETIYKIFGCIITSFSANGQLYNFELQLL